MTLRLTTRDLAGRRGDFQGVPVFDIPGLLPDLAPGPIDNADIFGIALHNDGIRYRGMTLAKDIERLNAIYNHAIEQGWKRFPYHMIASTSGILYVTSYEGNRASHIAHLNHRYRSVALMGDLTVDRPNTAQLCATAAGIVLTLKHMDRLTAIGPHSEFIEPRHGSPQHGHTTVCPGAFHGPSGWARGLWPILSFHAQELANA